MSASVRRSAAVLAAQSFKTAGAPTPINVLRAEFVHDKKSDIEWLVETDADSDDAAQARIRRLWADFVTHGNVDPVSLNIIPA
jgi:hypothetical protein